MTTILQVDGMSTGYGDLVVVRDVSFDVAQGKIVSLLGRNGAGKSTTLRAIAGLNPLKSGSVMLEGRNVSKLTPYERVSKGIAFVQEGKRIFRERTVEENLLLGGFSTGLARRQLMPALERCYAFFPILAERKSLLAGSLSGGQQQMLAIAQALVPNPKVLLLDEPSAGLAPVIFAEVLQTIVRLRNETSLSIVLVEQAADLVLSVADEVVVLEIGKVVLHRDARSPTVRDDVLRAYFSH